MAFCEPATIDEIKSHSYVLTPGRYVGAEEMENHGVPFEKMMATLSATLYEQFAKSDQLEASPSSGKIWRFWAMESKLTFNELVASIQQVHEQLAAQASKAVNISLTIRNWLVGLYIAEFELQGADRAKYGVNLLSELAKRLSAPKISNCNRRQLYRYLRFYRLYPQIVGTLSPQLKKLLPAGGQALEKVGSSSPQLRTPPEKLIHRLSYSHIEMIVDLDDELKRAFYEIECIRGNWSVRELKRQIGSLYYERSGLSKDKTKLAELTQKGAETAEPKLAIRKRILIGDTHNFVDLVFYHRVLKCHVLVELKLEQFSHENIGQINTYVSWYKKNMMIEGDNPPIGILLCTQKDHALVEYAIAGMDNNLFVSKYRLELPKKEEIQRFLEKKMREVSDE
jgi:predicted nuclease of restriction endonuclease-like (RecB) superfamily